MLSVQEGKTYADSRCVTGIFSVRSGAFALVAMA